MTAFVDTISNSLVPPVTQAVSDVMTVAGVHPIMLFMAFALASVFVLMGADGCRDCDSSEAVATPRQGRSGQGSRSTKALSFAATLMLKGSTGKRLMYRPTGEAAHA